MNKPDTLSLKEINAYKKKLSWGDVPAIYHMVSTSIGDLDGIFTHGFDSAYKQILNKSFWNLDLLGGYQDKEGNIQVKEKATVVLKHHYGDMGYELHCYPVINGEVINRTIENDGRCPFHHWYPESMQMLFRINSFVAYCIFSYQSGDEADMQLIKYAYKRVDYLINLLKESFDVKEVKGYNIAEFYQEIHNRKGNVLEEHSS